MAKKKRMSSIRKREFAQLIRVINLEMGEMNNIGNYKSLRQACNSLDLVFENVRYHARKFGYKFKNGPSAFVRLDFYEETPVNTKHKTRHPLRGL